MSLLRPRPRPRLLAATAVPALAGVAAAALLTVLAPTGAPAATPSTGSPPILDVTVGGGFTTPEYAFSTLPQQYVTSDGRLVTQGPQIMIYPPPALPNLRARQLTTTARTKLLAAATTAGLTAKAPDYGRPPVADVGTTTITVRKAGRTYVHAIYALGFDNGRTGPGLTDAQIAARARVQTFLRLFDDPVASFGARNVGPEKVFTASWFRVRATPATDTAATTGAPQPAGAAPAVEGAAGINPAGIAPAGEPSAAAPRPWPVPTVKLAKAAECAGVPATSALLTVLKQVASNQRWTQNGVVYDATLRPVLPGEPLCPSA